MSERTMQALRDRINARLQTKAISRDRASTAGREVVAQCRQSDVETLEWVLSEIDAALATPEPGGEGETLESRAYGIAHWIAMEARVAESLGRSVAPIEIEGARRIVALASARPTPAASEDVRERVRQAVEWGIEDAWPRYHRIYDPHDPDDESRQEWVDCITEQVVTALLRTPSGEGKAEPDVWCECGDPAAAQCYGCIIAEYQAALRSEAEDRATPTDRSESDD